MDSTKLYVENMNVEDQRTTMMHLTLQIKQAVNRHQKNKGMNSDDSSDSSDSSSDEDSSD